MLTAGYRVVFEQLMWSRNLAAKVSQRPLPSAQHPTFGSNLQLFQSTSSESDYFWGPLKCCCPMSFIACYVSLNRKYWNHCFNVQELKERHVYIPIPENHMMLVHVADFCMIRAAKNIWVSRFYLILNVESLVFRYHRQNFVGSLLVPKTQTTSVCLCHCVVEPSPFQSFG